MKKFNLLKGLAISLLSLALCFVAFGAVKASAFTATYDSDTDTVKVSGVSGAKLYYTDLKKSGKQKIKSVGEASVSGGVAVIVLDNKEEGIKVAENKTIYLYLSETDPMSAEKPEGTASITVKGSTVKKFAVTLNYACAASGEGTSGSGAPAFNATVDGKAVASPGTSVIFRSSTDGKTFGDWKAGSELTGDELYKAVIGDDTITYQFKLKDAAGARDSKPAKVKVAKAAKAPKVKVDYLKGTVALKNGFDFHVSASSAAPTTLEGWKTILPNNKLGTASKSGAIIETSKFVPYAKATDAASKAMFTKEKYKDLPVEDLFKDAPAAEEIYLYVRKSATAKKPASAMNEELIKIKKEAGPIAFSAVSGETNEKKVTTFTYSSNSGDVEYLILKSAEIPDLKDAKWAKLTSKGIVLKKSKTKVSKTQNNTLGDTSYVLIRIAGVKNESLPSAFTKTQIRKSTGASGETIYTWEPVSSGS